MYLFKNFLYVILFLGIIYIIIANRYFYNYHSTKNFFPNHSFDELRFIYNHYYTKKDMKIVKSGRVTDYFYFLGINEYEQNTICEKYAFHFCRF